MGDGTLYELAYIPGHNSTYLPAVTPIFFPIDCISGRC
jgi:hypothetical protein